MGLPRVQAVLLASGVVGARANVYGLLHQVGEPQGPEVTVPSRLSTRSNATAPPAPPCPEKFPGEPSTTCEGREGHQGPCMARVTVTWTPLRPDTMPSASGRNGVSHA